VGVPSVFVRTSGCNLRCAWCDTPYTSWEPTGSDRGIEDVLAEVESFAAARHVVVTGGEPMIAKGIVELTQGLRRLGKHITIETAGTVWAAVDVDLLSISPKLSNSVPDDEVWGSRHDERRIDMETLSRLLSHAPYQLKFVVSQERDLEELQDLVRRLGVDEPSRVLLMPESRSVDEMERVQGWLVDVCKGSGFRFCDRLHLRLFGNTPGT